MALTRVSPALFATSNNITSVTVGGSANTISLTFDSNGVITGASNNAVSVANTAITGNIISSQITSVANTQITGNIISSQIAPSITLTTPALGTPSALVLTNATGLPQAGLGTNVVGNGPAFSAYNSSSTTLSSVTYTKVALQTELFDTNSNFDSTTNYRFTPTVAGYYQINGGVSTNNPAGAVTAAIYKNGSIYQKGGIIVPQGGNSLAGSMVAGIVFLNGSTDYVELYGLQTNGSSQTTNANSFDTYFNGSMVRAS